MNASWIQYNVEQAKVKVSVVFAVCLAKTKHQSISGLGGLTQSLGVAEICACMEIDACQPVYDSTLTMCMHVCCRVHVPVCMLCYDK